MIATDSSCLTVDQLRDFAAGRLPADRFGQLLRHLDACPECQQRSIQLGELDDSLVPALASPQPVDPYAAEADCIAALHACTRDFDSLAPQSAPPVEQLGPYRLLRPLGSGGMGAVFLAQHTRLRRRCAIKLLPRKRGIDNAWRDRFEREMAAVAALSDPHVVAATDAGESDGWHYLVMEYLDGLDLSRLSARLGKLPVSAACELVRQTAVGLSHIHDAGLVHRDIKPSNLMLTRDGTVKILDLGLVLSDADPLPADDRLTTVGQLMGTLAYMAPEQLIDCTTVDDRADLYALGATLYRLLAGTAPHGSERGLAPLVVAKTGRPAPPIDAHRPDLPTPLVALLQQLLEREPAARPRSAAAVADALLPLAEGARLDRLVATALRKGPDDAEAASAASLIPLAAGQPAQPPRRRFPRTALAAAAALRLLVVAGIIITIVTDRGQLVIESEADGLAVQIERGEELVDQLRLSTGENRVTLRSGTYTITLDAAADGIQLSDNHFTVTRGDQTVVRVRREPVEAVGSGPATEDQTARSDPRYRGQTLAHWLTLLATERDVETVIDAMQAVVALAGDEARGDAAPTPAQYQRAEAAAAAMLRAARRFGGMESTGPGVQAAELQAPSARFMGYLLPLYPTFFPQPGLVAISHELANGTPESSIAAIWLLYNYANGHIESNAYRPEFGELQRWSKTAEGRINLGTLADHLDRAVERLGGYQRQEPSSANTDRNAHHRASAVGIAYELRLSIDALLGIDPLDDPAISDRLRESIEQTAAHYRQLFAAIRPSEEVASQRRIDIGPKPRISEAEVQAAIGQYDASTLAWAAVPSLLFDTDLQWAAGVLERLGTAAPTATADATVATLAQRGLTTGSGMGGMGGGYGILGGWGMSGYGPGLIQRRTDVAAGGGAGMGGFGGVIPADPDHVRLLVRATQRVGEHASDPERAIAVLHRVALSLEGEVRNLPSEAAPSYADLTAALQSAVEQLRSRSAAEARRGTDSDTDSDGRSAADRDSDPDTDADANTDANTDADTGTSDARRDARRIRPAARTGRSMR